MKEKNVVELKSCRDLTPRNIFSLPAPVAEKAFNTLGLPDRVNLVLALPWAKRLDAILMAADSRELLQALPKDEIYWTIKERGIEDSLALISMTSHDQLQYIIDIDCWHGGALNSAAIKTWYQMLSKCHESKVIEMFDNADDEFIIASLKTFFTVSKIEEETDISEEYEEMPDYTIDGIYYFQFLDNDARLFVMPILEVLYQHDRFRFYSLVEGVLWDSRIETEHEALHWRTSRVAEHGFPDFDEAGSIYRFISEEEITALLASIPVTKANGQPLEKKDVLLRYVFSDQNIPGFLGEVFRMVEDPVVLDTVQRDMVALSNKILIADVSSKVDSSEIKQALQKVAGYINIAIAQISESNHILACRYLECIHIQTLFSIGYSCILALQSKVKKQISSLWFDQKQLCHAFYDSPWPQTIDGILKFRPQFFNDVAAGGELKDFAEPGDLAAAEECLALVTTAEIILFEFFKIDLTKLQDKLTAQKSLDSIDKLKCSTLFLTVLINHSLRGEIECLPLTHSDIELFLDSASMQDSSGGRRIKTAFLEETITWLASSMQKYQMQCNAIDPFVNFCLKLFEDEFGSYDFSKKLDNRFVSTILM